MTIPSEELNALKQTYEFLNKLAQIKHPVKVVELRREALRCCKHYPFITNLEKMYEPLIESYNDETGAT